MRRIGPGVIAIACVMAYGVPGTRSAVVGADVRKELQTAIFHSTELAPAG